MLYILNYVSLFTYEKVKRNENKLGEARRKIRPGISSLPKKVLGVYQGALTFYPETLRVYPGAITVYPVTLGFYLWTLAVCWGTHEV